MDKRGQAGIEYAAVTALVALVFGGAAALTSGAVGTAIDRALARGICAVTAARCPDLRAAALPGDLEPCPLERSERNGDLSLDIGVARLAARLGLALERMSDGRVRVSFAEGGRVGAGVAVGAHIQIGPVAAKAEAEAEGGIAVTSGRVWNLPNRVAAERFIARYGESQRISGRLKQDIYSLCPACAAIGGGAETPPAPDERWIAGGPAVGSSIGVSAGPASGQLESMLRGALGRRIGPAGTTWFLRVDSQVLGSLDLFGRGRDRQLEAHSVAAIDMDPSGRPLRLRLTVERRLSDRRGASLPRALRPVLGSFASGIGSVLEGEVSLDLSEPRARMAALAIAGKMRGIRPLRSARQIERLAEAIERSGVRTVRLWVLKRSGTRIGIGAALGGRLGVDVQSRSDGQELVAVATKLPGLGWLPRADCLAV